MRAIITFHSVDSSGSVLSFDPDAFAGLLNGIGESQLPVCDLNTLLDRNTTRGVALTFDDGMASVFDNALPVLEEYQYPAHLFLTTGAVGGTNGWHGQPDWAPSFEMLNWDQIEKCHEAGVRIECHTVSHIDLRGAGHQELEDECGTADEIINRRLGRKPEYFAYPYGYNDCRSRDFMRGRYAGSVTTRMRVLGKSEDMAALPRIDSYYLKIPWVYRDLNSIRARFYIMLRGIVRRCRQYGK